MARRFIIGISGASGAVYAQRVIGLLAAGGAEVHLVVSPLGQRVLHEELGMEGVDLDALAGVSPTRLPEQEEADHALAAAPGRVVLHNYRDVGAPIASGSFLHDGMVIVPCSSNTLSAVAHGAQPNLLHRAAAVTLKERRRLVLVHRETPLTLIDIRNMEQATLAGAIICPASPGFYMLPRELADLVDFMAARVLDLLGVQHDLNVRWGQEQKSQVASPKSQVQSPG